VIVKKERSVNEDITDFDSGVITVTNREAYLLIDDDATMYSVNIQKRDGKLVDINVCKRSRDYSYLSTPSHSCDPVDDHFYIQVGGSSARDALNEVKKVLEEISKLK
jgi:hypothetical protein